MTKSVTFPAFLSGVFFTPALFLSVLVINEFHPEQVIEFTLSNHLRLFIGLIPTVMGSVLLTHILKESTDLSHNLNFDFSYYPITILCALLCAFPELAMLTINNEYYSESMKTCIVILALGTYLSAFKSSVSRMLVKKELGKLSIFSNASWFLMFVALNIALVPDFGAVGACVSFTLSQFLNFLLWMKRFAKFGLFPNSARSVYVGITSILVFFSSYAGLNDLKLEGMVVVFIVLTISIYKFMGGTKTNVQG